MEDRVANPDETDAASDAASDGAPAAPPADGPLEALESPVEAPSGAAGATLAAPPLSTLEGSAGADAATLARAAQIDQIIESWMHSHIYSSPLSRDTVAWNHLRAKLPALRDILMEI